MEVIVEPRRARLWAVLREAVRGTDQSFTTGPLGRGVFLLAVPMVIEMAGESLFALVDAFFVARLGAEALASVGLTEACLEIVYAIAVGLATGTTALVARRIGAGDAPGARVVAVQSLGIGLGVAAVFGTAGWFATPSLLRFMGGDPSTVRTATPYMRWMLGGEGTILLLFLVSGIFRGAGDAAIAMRALWIANGVNIVLDPCLIFGYGPFPELGLAGAAISTNIGRGLGVTYALSRLFAGHGRVGLGWRDVRFDFGVAAHLLRVSAGGIAQYLIAGAAWIGLARVLATFGSIVLAGYVVAIRIVIFVILPAWGFSNAAATLVGQNLGAGRPDRAERATLLTGFWNMAFMLGIMVLFLFAAEPIVNRFTADASVHRTAVDALRIISYGYGFYAWGMVMTQAFNGAGDTMTPMFINLVCFWLFQIPMAMFLSRAMGPSGVFWAIALSYSLSAIMGLTLFRRGRWKMRKV